MITGRGHPLTQEHAEAGKYAPLMMFDCRGYEPVDFVFGSGWKAESVSIDFSLHRIKLRIVFFLLDIYKLPGLLKSFSELDFLHV